MASRQRVDFEDELNLLDYLRAIRRHWRMEAAMLGVCLAAALAFVLLWPSSYVGIASVLPPTETAGASALSAISSLTGDAGSMLGLPAASSNKDVYVGILLSRTVQEEVIKKFDLVNVYGYAKSSTPQQDTRKKLERMVDISVTKEGVIQVSTWAYTRAMAADMANFYVDLLDRLNTELNVSDARRSRIFLEVRVGEAKRALMAAEDRLRDYQSRSKVVVIDGQARAALEAAAILEGQIMAAEVQLKAMEVYATPRNPDVIRVKEAIDEMRRQLRKKEYGSTGGPRIVGASPPGDFSVPLGSIPTAGLDIVRLIREAKIQETIFGVLTQQLEQARLTEARDTPTVRMLDRASPPEGRDFPKLGLTLGLGGALGLALGLFLAVFREYLAGLRRTERA